MDAAAAEADATGAAAREGRWAPTLVALAVALAVTAAPLWPTAAAPGAALVRAAVPIEQIVLLVVPALAANALVGWLGGGRFLLAAAWTALAGWMIAQPLPASAVGYAALARGWPLVLAAIFGALTALGGADRRFLPRALAAVGLTVAVSSAALLASGRDPGRLQPLVQSELERRVDATLAPWSARTASSAWRATADRRPEAVERAERADDELRALPAVTAVAAPALLALESLAALALAWTLYHRLSRARIGRALAPLATFRFNDQLVWGLVAGATVVALPTLAALRPVGINLLVFFGALYALRGLSVLLWLAAPARLPLGAAAVFAVLFPTAGLVVLGTLAVIALAIGLGDTWGGWRSRRAALPPRR